MDWAFDGVEFDEEVKLREETRKILELPTFRSRDLRARAGDRRARGGDLGRAPRTAVGRARRTGLLATRPGAAPREFPTPAGGESTTSSSAASADTVENGLALFVVCDNLRKGAALSAIQIAELLLAEPRVAA